MAVNLGGLDLTGGAPLDAPRKSSGSQPLNSEPSETSSKAPEVSITSTAALLAHLEQSLSSVPAVNQERVAALSKAIESGNYQIQPHRITDGLLQSEQALAQLPTRAD